MMLIDELTSRAEAAYNDWRADRPYWMAVDTETTGLTFDDRPFCVTVAWKAESGDIKGHYLELEHVENPLIIERLVRTMLNDTRVLIFHNAKFDMQKLQLAGLMEPRLSTTFGDTETMAHLVDEHQRLGLKSLARELLGIETDEEATLKAVRRELKLTKNDGYHKLPREIVIPYAIEDARMTYMLWERLWPEIDRHNDLTQLYLMECELCLTLGDMEAAGMRVDVDYLKTTAREYASKALKAEVAIRELVGDEDFNPNSPKQLL